MRLFRFVFVCMLALFVIMPVCAQQTFAPDLPSMGWYVDEARPKCGPYPASVSTRGMDFIKDRESFFATPYKDSVGWAVGYGFHSWNGKPVTPVYPVSVTVAQADAEFASQIVKYEAVVRRVVCATLPQHSYDALVSVAFNLGSVNKSIVKKLAAKQTVTKQDFLATATVHKVMHPVLVDRRLSEFAMFRGVFILND